MKKQELHLIFQDIKQGDQSKLDDLYKEFNKLIYGIAFSILKNKEDSEDIVQIVFTKICQLNKERLPSANEATWLYSLTKNETLNYIRGKKEEISLDEIYYLSAEAEELNKIIDNNSYNRIIAKLDKQEQEIVSLKILSKMSFKEISILLEIPMGTVQWKYYSSLYTLRLLLGNISMVIIGILLFVKANIADKGIEEIIADSEEDTNNQTENIIIDSEADNQLESDVEEDATSSSIENILDSTIITNETVENEIIEVSESQENNVENYNIGILCFTGVFLVFSIIFTIIFIKHQQNAHKNVSK